MSLDRSVPATSLMGILNSGIMKNIEYIAMHYTGGSEMNTIAWY